MEYKFKQIKLSNAEKLWLTEILKLNFSNVDVKTLKVKLWKRVPEDFDPMSIDSRLICDNHPTLIGLWHVDPQNPIFSQVSKTIETIRDLIQKHPDINRIKAKEIAQLVGITERETEIALMLIYDLGGFFGSSSASNTRKGFQEVAFPQNNSAYDEFLKFKNLEQKMEQFFLRCAPSNIKKKRLTKSQFLQNPDAFLKQQSTSGYLD